jgi:hypothetical protein
MPKRRNLNGLPHNLTKSFLGTLNYYHCGYMADWLVNAASRRNLSAATLDILNATIEPAELNLYPLLINLKSLKPILERELHANGFPLDFITEAKIKVEFLYANTRVRKVYCFPTLLDKEGRQYTAKRIVEYAYEDFDPFDPNNIYPTKPSVFDQMKSLFNK